MVYPVVSLPPSIHVMEVGKRKYFAKIALEGKIKQSKEFDQEFKAFRLGGLSGPVSWSPGATDSRACRPRLIFEHAICGDEMLRLPMGTQRIDSDWYTNQHGVEWQKHNGTATCYKFKYMSVFIVAWSKRLLPSPPLSLRRVFRDEVSDTCSPMLILQRRSLS